MRRCLPLVVAVLVGCGVSEDIDPPATGSIEVTTETTGNAPDAQYSISLDGVLQDWIGPNASRTLTDIDPGAYIVTLGDVAPHCTVDPPTAQAAVNVTAGDISGVDFAILCVTPPPPPPPQTGAIGITTVTTGGNPDPDGYAISLDGNNAGAIGVNDQVVISDLDAGGYSIGLTNVASNCTVAGDNPRAVEVVGGLAAQAQFDVDCPSAP
jgi:hypothetical protein